MPLRIWVDARRGASKPLPMLGHGLSGTPTDLLKTLENLDKARIPDAFEFPWCHATGLCLALHRNSLDEVAREFRDISQV